MLYSEYTRERTNANIVAQGTSLANALIIAGSVADAGSKITLRQYVD